MRRIVHTPVAIARTRAALGYAATAALALTVALACGGAREIDPRYRCKPSSEAPEQRCPEQQLCCSDDPAALDPDDPGVDALPHFTSDIEGNSGTPLFAEARNDASEWGLCVRQGSVPPAWSLANGCPIPCNPSWAQADVALVCGEQMLCCQSAELEPEDCVFDSGLGAQGCWRAVRGGDIVGLGGLDATDWSADAHATHQDPGGRACQAFVEGLSGVDAQQLMNACLRRLGTAATRGWCISSYGAAGGCPLAQPSYRDACEQRNDAEGRSDCG